MIRLIFLIILISFVSALTEEFEFQSTGHYFVLDGTYETGNFAGKEFWICIDYDAISIEQHQLISILQTKPDSFMELMRGRVDIKQLIEVVPPNPYPVDKCGGKSRSTRNPYWFALHGIWKSHRVLEMRFVSAFEVWPLTWKANVKSRDYEFLWNSNVLRKSTRHSREWKLVQTYGKSSTGFTRPSISSLNLIGSGKVDTISPISIDTLIYVRVNGDGVRVKDYSVKLLKTVEDPFSRFYERLGDK